MSLAKRINVPDLPSSVPHRSNWLSHFIGRLSMAASGWTIEGNFPDEPKYIIAVVPHTSNVDFLVGLNLLLAMGLRLDFMGKKTLFWEPLGTILRWLGGVPIDRNAPGGTVGSAIEQFNRHDQFVLVITPEGTRNKVEKWKTGFYHIAYGAGVPIVPAGFDYGTKTIKIGSPLMPNGNMDTDFIQLQEFFAGIVAKHPENA